MTMQDFSPFIPEQIGSLLTANVLLYIFTSVAMYMKTINIILALIILGLLATNIMLHLYVLFEYENDNTRTVYRYTILSSVVVVGLLSLCLGLYLEKEHNYFIIFTAMIGAVGFVIFASFMTCLLI